MMPYKNKSFFVFSKIQNGERLCLGDAVKGTMLAKNVFGNYKLAQHK